MAASDARLEALIESLMQIGAVKFGTFTLKSGVTSPIYIDLRVLPSHPPVLNEVMEVINDRLQSEGVKFDLVCGVPYTALPMATLLAVKRNVPMVICRKEEKAYGTKKIVDGVYSEGQSVLIIEDVVTSGISIAQTGENLRKSGLKADTAIVFLNREQGGTDNLHKQGYKLHSVIPISRLLDVLGRKGLLSKERIEEVRQHLSSTVTSIPRAPELPLLQRATMAKSPVAKALFQVMADKSTNIAVAADVSSAEELLRLAEEVGPEICLLKTHVDILDKFDAATRDALVSLAKKHNFLIMEDRKFADIGSVAAKQYAAGPFRIAEWSRLVTVHVIAGEASVAAMTTDAARHQNGVLLIAEMSSAGAGTSEQTVQSALEIAKKHPGLVAGFICQRRLSEDAEAQAFLYCTPGVSLEQTGDGQGQQYNGPEQLVARGTDVLIVGRGIVAQADRKAAAAKYRAAGWQALTKRLAAGGHAQA